MSSEGAVCYTYPGPFMVETPGRIFALDRSLKEAVKEMEERGGTWRIRMPGCGGILAVSRRRGE